MKSFMSKITDLFTKKLNKREKETQIKFSRVTGKKEVEQLRKDLLNSYK